MGKKSSPKAPDYKGAAEASAEASRENIGYQTWANRPDQFNPWGSQTWENRQVWDPATQQYVTQWAQNVSLDPTLQWALDNQIYLQGARSDLGGQLMDRAYDEFGQPMDWSQFSGWADAPDVNYLNPMQQQGAVDTWGMQQVGVGAGAYGPQQQNYQMYGAQSGIGATPDWIRREAEDAIYGKQASRLDPRFERERNQLEQKLVGQGLRVGDAAYDRAMRQFEETRNDAYDQAYTSSIMGGGQEAQRDYEQRMGQAGLYNQAMQQLYGQNMGVGQQRFNEQLQGGQFELQQQQQMHQQQMALREQQFKEAAAQRGMDNEAAEKMWQAERGQLDNMFQQQMAQSNYMNELRINQIQEEMQRRGFSLNEINALISGQQVNNPQFAGFSNAGLAETPDYMGAANAQYQGALQSSSAKQGAFGDMMGGLFSMAGSVAPLIPWSDRRLKTDIKRIGKTPGGVNVYSFRYVWGEPAIGVMADEVPWAAVEGPGGFQKVDYSKVK